MENLKAQETGRHLMAGDAKTLRFGVDTGGTFTDLVVDGLPGGVRVYKRPTTPDDPVRGLLDVISAAADNLGISPADLLGRGELLVFGTTRATNAIIERATGRTALLVTQGHPDILMLREGGDRPSSLYDWSDEYYLPHVPRSLTFEVPERIGSRGEIVTPLDSEAARALLGQFRSRSVEAIAVCLLWSIANPEHELELERLIEEELPDVPYTLSHRLNPSIREYRRASSAALDASLKPLMSHFFGDLDQRMREAGFSGQLLVMTSSGGVLDSLTVREAPIHSIGSGPAAAPVAGRRFVAIDVDADSAIVTDAGGTSYDVSLVRRGEIPWTRETTVGEGRYRVMTGFPSVDARSIGAGGGSIAWVDDGGLLSVGPRSAGAVPGPACYGEGGVEPTVTDACVVLGFIDPNFFLGGEMTLDADLARGAVEEHVGKRLGLGVEEAASAVFQLATEHMVDAIEHITLVQGVDPTHAVMVAGGGGGGLYSSTIGRRLGSPLVVMPEVGAALSATGTILSDLQRDFAATELCVTDRFDRERANAVLERLLAEAGAFGREMVSFPDEVDVTLSVEARYANQIWEIEVPLAFSRFDGPGDVERLREDFHRTHEELFAFTDPGSPVEVVAWRARARLRLGDLALVGDQSFGDVEPSGTRSVLFPGIGVHEAPTYPLDSVGRSGTVSGPAIVESALTTVVVEPGASLQRAPSGSLLLRPPTGTDQDPNEERVKLERVT